MVTTLVKMASKNYLVPSVEEKCCDRLCMVSWVSIIPGLAALQHTEWTEKKIPNRKLGSGSLSVCFPLSSVYLADKL